jgi:hypothetical protein
LAKQKFVAYELDAEIGFWRNITAVLPPSTTRTIKLCGIITVNRELRRIFPRETVATVRADIALTASVTT